jgi:hypothetical protein
MIGSEAIGREQRSGVGWWQCTNFSSYREADRIKHGSGFRTLAIDSVFPTGIDVGYDIVAPCYVVPVLFVLGRDRVGKRY